MGVDVDIDPSNYDPFQLFPPGISSFYSESPSSEAKITSVDSWKARCWLRVSAVTTTTVGMAAKLWMRGEEHSIILETGVLNAPFFSV